jgi:8-hydroxy-5-deazaflavin:NADPH oxidoreductase
MKIGIFGTGMVGRSLAGKMVGLGHAVMIGTRSVEETQKKNDTDFYGNPPFRVWHARNQVVRLRTLAEAAEHGELLVNAVSGGASLDALKVAGERRLGRKILIDVANPLDFSKGMPPTLSVCNTDSLAERIQKAFPDLRVVKTLNTMNAALMVDPGSLADGDHCVFVSGNDAGAKAMVTDILKSWFGWKQVIDLGDISSARGTEMLLPVWLRLMAAFNSAAFNFRIVKAD